MPDSLLPRFRAVRGELRRSQGQVPETAGNCSAAAIAKLRGSCRNMAESCTNMVEAGKNRAEMAGNVRRFHETENFLRYLKFIVRVNVKILTLSRSVS